MKLVNPIEKSRDTQFENSSFNLQADCDISQLISLDNKIPAIKNNLINISQTLFKIRFYFYFSSLRVVMPKQARTIALQYLYETLYSYVMDNFMTFSTHKLILRDQKADNQSRHHITIHNIHYLIDKLFRYYIDFPSIRQRLSNELHDIANQDEIGNLPFYEKLDTICIHYNELLLQIGYLNHQRIH